MNAAFSAPLTDGLTALLGSVAERAPITTDDVVFERDGVSFVGFLARPTSDDGASLPAVLIFSDWTGLNDIARVRATMLARLGYVAFAGDIYGGGIELSQEDAGPAAGKYYGDPELFRARATANFEHLASLDGVDAARIAVMGYCFGGSASLELARTGATAAGIVSFHGGLKTGMPAALGSIQTPILVLTGAADPVVPDEDVIAFENELREAGAPDWQIVSYSGAMHAFTMPDTNAPESGAQFQAVANKRSWVAMTAFFAEVLAK